MTKIPNIEDSQNYFGHWLLAIVCDLVIGICDF